MNCPLVWMLTSEIEGERAGSFRQARWAQVFLDAGAIVRVFNVQGAFHLHEETFTTRAEFDAFRQARRTTARPAASVREGPLVGIVRAIKHLFLIDFYLPNILKLISIGRAALKQSGPVIVLSSSPPFSLAVAGWWLKRAAPAKVTFLVDMRDAWALHTSLGGIKPMKRAIESAVLRKADRVSTVSHGLADEFNDAYGVKVEVLYNVATHYFDVAASAPLDWASLSPALATGRRRYVYTGSTPTGFYDLKSLAQGVNQLRTSRPDLADLIQLVFVGACEEMRKEAQAAGVSHDDIAFVPHVPHKIATAIQQNSDGLLFLAYDGEGNKGVVSTKFFEYLALGKPILPISLHRMSDVDQLLHRFCGSSLNLLTATDMTRALEALASQGKASLPQLAPGADVSQLLNDYRGFVANLLSPSSSCEPASV